MVITRAKNGSPDMILSAFDVKFNEKQNEIPPRPRRPAAILKKLGKYKQMQEEMGPPPARPPERGVRVAQPPQKKKKGCINL